KKMPRLNRRQRVLVQCAPFNDDRIEDRAMRAAVFKVKKTEEFTHQRAFDQAVAGLVQAIAIPTSVTEWLSKGTFVAPPRRTWRQVVMNPVVLAIGIAVGVIAGIFVFKLVERLNQFPGEPTAKRLLNVASSTKSVILDPVKTDAGALGDFFFMKHRLAHYDVPAEFAELKTLGCRVFDDEESQTIAQIWVVEKKMQFFLFPAERDLKTGAIKHFTGWRYVDQDRWSGVVQEKNGVCFMAAIRGPEKELRGYVDKPKE
ncbi:MAG TPA: hypothetical protein VJ719_06260, partial [Chthoniobacterales bacterium]|nr:hypothetical protein [Chthoniobacterales bacterium]